MNKKKNMRKLVIIIILAGFGWSGYWFIGKSTRLHTLNQWFAARENDGWIANSRIKITGFPNRYDAIITNLELANQKNGWGWVAPKFELLQLSYNKNHFIARWPEKQFLHTPTQRIKISTHEMRASFSFDNDANQPIKQATLKADQISLQSTAAWHIAMQTAITAIRKTPNAENTYDIALSAENITSSHKTIKHIQSLSTLPSNFKKMVLNFSMKFAHGLTRETFENGKIEPERLIIEDMHLEWGHMVLRAKGTMDINKQGYPTGKLTLRAINWESMLDLANKSGAISQHLSQTLHSAFGLLASLSGNRNNLEVPLTFKNKKIKLGPITIGKAPRLALQ